MQDGENVGHLYDSILTGEMLFQKSITPMMLVDGTRTIIKANHRFCEMFGYAIEDVMGKQTVILTPSETHFREYAKTFKQTLDGSIESSELQYKKSDGTLFWVKLTGVPLETEAGKFVLWSLDDITQEVNTRENLERSHKELEIIFDRTKVGLMYVVHGVIQKANNALMDIIGSDLATNLLGEKVDVILECFDRCKDENTKKIKRFLLRNGNVILTEREIVKIAEARYLVIFSDITLHIKEKESLTKLAEIDGLTKVYNRRAFTHIVQRIISEKQYDIFSFVMLDIDFFKKINDSWGHDIGDVVLIELSSLIKKLLRKEAIIGRMGGEEFGIILFTGRDDAAIICERIRQAVLEHQFIDNKLAITISLGVVDNTDFDVLDFDTMYKAADKNLYEAKRKGRNKLVY